MEKRLTFQRVCLKDFGGSKKIDQSFQGFRDSKNLQGSTLGEMNDSRFSRGYSDDQNVGSKEISDSNVQCLGIERVDFESNEETSHEFKNHKGCHTEASDGDNVELETQCSMMNH